MIPAERHFVSSLAAFCALAVLMTGACPSFAAETELTLDYQRDNLSLNGEWQKLLDHSDEPIWKDEAASAATGWVETKIPGVLLAHRKSKEGVKVKCFWVRRSFTLDKAQATRSAALKWGGIRFGGSAWINGRKITTNPTIGPHMTLVPNGVLKAGENVIVIKVSGWAGIPMAAKGNAPGKPLIPTGASVESWGSKVPAIYDDIYLEFYDRAYLKWLLAMPDVVGRKVTFRIWVDSAGKVPDSLEISAVIRDREKQQPAAKASMTATNFDKPVELTVAIPDAKLWTPQTPNLYEVQFEARAGGKVCDRVRFSFGMREIRIVDGHYQLNGKPLWFRGSNLVKEWRWGSDVSKYPKRYIVDEARVMNLNSFRTHTGPPPTRWVNVADEHGTMILAEMPVLQNYSKFNFSPEEWGIWRKNVMIDTPQWITKLWNHPSIVLWVLSNETFDGAWESGPYRDAIIALDPTRPTMRTGALGEVKGTADNLDLHPCANFVKGPEGGLIQTVIEHARNKAPEKTLTNTEYMNWFGSYERSQLLWMGKNDKRGEDDEFMFARADCGAEHTEAMRRLSFDGILPYMYAGWTGLRTGKQWRPEFPTMMAAALHSSMAPVLASLDLFDRNFVAGQEVSTQLCLINELHEDVDVTIDLYITPKNPMLVPDADALSAAIWTESLKRTLKADSIVNETIRWNVPDKEGAYYLAAVLNRPGARAVVSQRMVRSIAPVDTAARLGGKKILVLGADEAIEGWLKANNADYSTGLTDGKIDADVVLLWDLDALGPETLAQADAIRKYVKGGGRMVILHQTAWTWKQMDEELQSYLLANRADYKKLAIISNREDASMLLNIGAIHKLKLSRVEAIRKYIDSGGRVLIHNRGEWSWKKLLDFEISRETDWLRGRASRVFPYEYVNHPVMKGIDPEWLKRWNGLPGLIADGWLVGEALQNGTKIIWQEEPHKPVVMAFGIEQGEILVSLLHLKQRISRDGEAYDPAAERIFVNMLAP